MQSNRPAYSTADEIAFLRSLWRRGRTDTLRQLQAIYTSGKRTWSGDGMAVDQQRVLACLARLLGGRSR